MFRCSGCLEWIWIWIIRRYALLNPDPRLAFSITPSITFRPLTMPVVHITIFRFCPAASMRCATNRNAAISVNVIPPKNMMKTVFQPLVPVKADLAFAAFSSSGRWMMLNVGPLADLRMSSKPVQPVLVGVRGGGICAVLGGRIFGECTGLYAR